MGNISQYKSVPFGVDDSMLNTVAPSLDIFKFFVVFCSIIYNGTFFYCSKSIIEHDKGDTPCFLLRLRIYLMEKFGDKKKTWLENVLTELLVGNFKNRSSRRALLQSHPYITCTNMEYNVLCIIDCARRAGPWPSYFLTLNGSSSNTFCFSVYP